MGLTLKALLRTVKPPPKLTLSQWADRFRILSAVSAARPGRWNTENEPYQREMMDTATDPEVQAVIIMSSSQIGKTEVVLNLAGYHMHQDPAPILVIQPTLEMANAWSKDRLTPMLRDSPCFQGLVRDARTRDSGNTVLHKQYVGGQIVIAGANSPASLASRPIRVVLFDEVDRYPPTAGVEGDPIAIARRRSVTFWNRREVVASTPTIKGVSRIEAEFERSDKRRYHVRCPHCDEEQVLEWGGRTTPYGIKWRQDEKGRHLPETAFYLCRQGCVIEEKHKGDMVRRGRWIATAPFKGIAGFHIWAGYSLGVNTAWPRLVAEWLDAKNNPWTRQVFINTVLGESYEDRGERELGELGLLRRCEVWEGEVPGQVGVLTAGVDVQDDRIEIEVVGWGRNEESWSLAYEIIEGEPESPDLWRAVDQYLRRRFVRSDGRAFVILGACVDSGGHHTQRVYEFCKARIGRRIWAIKGESARGGARSPVWPVKRPLARNKVSYRPIIIGVNAAKDVIRARLSLDEPGSGYCHFPADRDINYFAQLVSERLVTRPGRAGALVRLWELPPGRRNEALDVRVYAYAALAGLMHFGLSLNKTCDEVAGPDTHLVNVSPMQPPPPPVAPPPVVSQPEGPSVIVQSRTPRRSRFGR